MFVFSSQFHSKDILILPSSYTVVNPYLDGMLVESKNAQESTITKATTNTNVSRQHDAAANPQIELVRRKRTVVQTIKQLLRGTQECLAIRRGVSVIGCRRGQIRFLLTNQLT